MRWPTNSFRTFAALICLCWFAQLSAADPTSPAIVKTVEGKVWRLDSAKPENAKKFHFMVDSAEVDADLASIREVRFRGDPKIVNPDHPRILWRTAVITYHSGEQQKGMILVSSYAGTGHLVGVDAKTGALVKLPLKDLSSVTYPAKLKGNVD